LLFWLSHTDGYTMKFTKFQLGCIALALAVAALLLFFLSREAPDRQPVAAPQAPEPTKSLEIAPAAAAYDRDIDALGTVSDDERAERNEARPESGSGESQLEHLLRSVVMANAEQVNLTPAEVDQLASTYLEFQEIHAELAARFLQETSFDPGSVTLRLPAYPVEGKLLRDMFHRRVGSEFPGEKGAAIQENMGVFFDNAFRGFGVTEQTFTITRSSDVPDAFEVTWEAKIPDGQTVGAVNPDVSFAGSSGTVLLYREQVATGEYRFLGSVLERRFPAQ
jgi:hypothetical protein